MRLQFPLYKLFLIMAAYAAAFGSFAWMGWIGAAFATFVGTAASGLILAIHRSRDVGDSLWVAFGCFVGAFFLPVPCPMCLGPRINEYTYLTIIMHLSVGAALGGLVVASLRQQRRRRREQKALRAMFTEEVDRHE